MATGEALPTSRTRRTALRTAAMLGAVALSACAPGAPVTQSPESQKAEADTERLQALLRRGGDVVVPPGTYVLRVDASGRCLVLDQPGTRLLLDGVTLQLAPTTRGSYSLLKISAPDCSVRGGSLIGDVRRHLGTTGEWGHGLAVAKGGDRALLSGVTVRECWGDGIHVSGGVRDLEVSNCLSVGNRRQGLSIVDAVNPVVRGGVYADTGLHGHVSPASGIDVEPGQGARVTGLTIEGVTVRGNRGAGLILSGHGRALSATVTDLESDGNHGVGVLVDGVDAGVELIRARASGNDRGFYLMKNASGVVLQACTALKNEGLGFQLAGGGGRLVGCSAEGNATSGFRVDVPAEQTQLVRCQSMANGTRGNVEAEFDIAGPRTQLVGAQATGSPTGPAWALWIRSTAVGSAQLGGVWGGQFSSGTERNDVGSGS